jgi:hypothetical protein
MIAAMKGHNVEEKFFGSIVLRSAEYYVESDPSDATCLFFGMISRKVV